jgi:hypothetical protein
LALWWCHLDNRRLTWNLVKALVKGLIGALVLIAISGFTACFAEVLPAYCLAFHRFALIFILFTVISQLLSDTIFQCIFNVFSALFIVGYLLYAFTADVLVISIENVTFMVNLKVILSVIIILSLVSFAKTVLELVNYLIENVKVDVKD